MYIQRLAEAASLKSNVLPGFTLMVSTKDTPLWPKGWYGLVESGDPVVVFEGPLLRDPTIGLTEDDLDPMPCMPDGYEEYSAGAKRLGFTLRVPPGAGYRLVQASISQGYKPQEHGSIEFWLLNHLAQQVDASE